MRIRARIRSYFGFSRLETNGFLILMPLILVILFSRPLAVWWIAPESIDNAEDARKLDSLLKSIQWVSLQGEKPAQRLISSEKLSSSAHRNSRKKGQGQQQTPQPIDINEADSIQLTAVKGIGPVLARRIRLYRDRLGGFITMGQLREVYGLDTLIRLTMAKHFFVKEGFSPHRIDLNAALPEDLTHHPYISWATAKAIVLYRFQHGPFHTAEDLHAIQGITSDWVARVGPYLEFR